MNATSRQIYENQKRMNDNTRTATVYTSDITQRIKKSSSSSPAKVTRATV
jgi:hypothetical protein